MAILALDTSTDRSSVAALDGAREAIADGEGRHDDDLLGLIDRVLGELGVSLDQLEAIAIGAGPGSFTGLRIGMATVKGLCFATGKPLWPVSSLAALALGAATLAPPDAVIGALLDARRGEVYAGFYRVTDGLPIALGPERVCPPDALAAIARELADGCALCFAGDGARAYPGEVAALGTILAAAPATPSGRAIGRLALAGPRTDALLAATPAYLRPAEAEIMFPPGSKPGGSFVLGKP